MKRFAPLIILFLFAMLAWDTFSQSDTSFVFDGDDFDGPVGAVLGTVFAGGGLLIAAAVLACVGVMLALLFAGIGIVVIGGLCVGAVVLAALVSPLLLPLLIPLGIIWLLTRRSRQNRRQPQ